MSKAIVATRYAEVLAIAGFSFWLGAERQPEPAVALILAVAAFAVTEYKYLSNAESRREADRANLRAFIGAFPPAVVDFLREHDFGNHFLDAQTDPLDRFAYEWQRPDRRFLDGKLQDLLNALLGEVEAFRRLVAAKTFPQGPGRQGVEKERRDGPNRDEYDEVVEGLNRHAGRIAELQEQLVTQARTKLGI